MGTKIISTHTLTWSVTIITALAFVCLDISTHTLTWSVTNYPLEFDDEQKISTHTLTWSVTVQGSSQVFVVFHFNSHAHVERDT